MKIITSTIKALPGTVGLYDPLPLDKIYLIEELIFERNKPDNKPERRAELHGDFFKVIFSCVEKWDLSGLREGIALEDLRVGEKMKRKTFGALENWLTTEVMALYYGDGSDPNE